MGTAPADDDDVFDVTGIPRFRARVLQCFHWTFLSVGALGFLAFIIFAVGWWIIWSNGADAPGGDKTAVLRNHGSKKYVTPASKAFIDHAFMPIWAAAAVSLLGDMIVNAIRGRLYRRFAPTEGDPRVIDIPRRPRNRGQT